MNNDTDIEFLTKATTFVSQIDSKEHLKSLFVASLSLIKDKPNNSIDECLDTIIKVAKNNNMLEH